MGRPAVGVPLTQNPTRAWIGAWLLAGLWVLQTVGCGDPTGPTPHTRQILESPHTRQLLEATQWSDLESIAEEIAARGDSMPGLLFPALVGGPVGLIVGGALQGTGETSSRTISHIAQSTSSEIARELESEFRRVGWI